VTAVVIEVGPCEVRGPAGIDADRARLALDCIDDDMALVGDRPVEVAGLLHDVLAPLVGAGAAILVVPSWWPPGRTDRIRRAVRGHADNVVVLERSRVLGGGCTARTLVEIAPDLVVLSADASRVAVVPRLGEADEVASAVANAVGGQAAVLVDAPPGVDGASHLASAICAQVRAGGGAVSIADPDLVMRCAANWDVPLGEPPTGDRDCVRRAGPRRRAIAALAGTAISAAALCAALAAEPAHRVARQGSPPMTTLVEGRVRVDIPAAWRVERITSGPGSARVQVISPRDADAAVLVVQSRAFRGQTLQMAADVLREALDGQPGGVFTQFNPADRRAGRPAVTYREIREGGHILWAVLLDGDIRIAIGCRSGIGREPAVRPACDEAIRTARAVS